MCLFCKLQRAVHAGATPDTPERSSTGVGHPPHPYRRRTLCLSPAPGVLAARLPGREEGQKEGALLTRGPPLAQRRYRASQGREGSQEAGGVGRSWSVAPPTTLHLPPSSGCLSVRLRGAACPAGAGGRLQGTQLFAGPCQEPNT